jgi:hypothetical protein
MRRLFAFDRGIPVVAELGPFGSRTFRLRNMTRPTATFIAGASVSSGATRLPNAPGTARIVTDLVTFTVVVLKVNRIENPRLAAGVDSRERRRQQAIWLLDCARG